MLLTKLITSLRDEVSNAKYSMGKAGTSPVWHNLVYISYMVEELIFGSHNREILQHQEGAYLDHSRDFKGQPLFKWIHDEGYLLYYDGSNEKSLWAEWSILEALFTTIDAIYPDWCIKSLAKSIDRSDVPYVETVFSLLEKT